MLYIRIIEIVDEYDNVIYRGKKITANEGINKALQIIRDKDSPRRAKGIFKRFLKDIDNELKSYFDLGAK